jgi:hypothetical protein
LKPKLALAAALFAASLPIVAHHSFAAEYDANAKVEFDGVVTKVEWTNPHAHYYVDVKGADGKVANWNMELASPNMLNRNGWTRKTLFEGQQIHVTGSRAKDGSNTAATSTIRLPDGKMLTMTGVQQVKQQ